MLWNPWIVLIHRYHSSCCDYGTEKRMGTHEWLNHSSTKTGQAHISFQMAEVAIPRHLFADILWLIAQLRAQVVPSTG